MSVIPYEKVRELVEMCERLHKMGETDLENQMRERAVTLLRAQTKPRLDMNLEEGKQVTFAEMPEIQTHSRPTVIVEEKEEVEELTIREIHGLRLAWNPSNNYCYELLSNDEVGKWLGVYDPSTGRVDPTVPDPESKDPNWTTQAPFGIIDPFKKDFLRRTLIHGEEIAVTTSPPKQDGSSTVKSILPRILAVNKPNGSVGFIHKGRLYNNPTSLVRDIYPGKTTASGWPLTCVRRPNGRGIIQWISLYKLEHP